MTELPDGWVDDRFGDVLTARYGKALEKSLRTEGGPVPVVGSAGTMTATTKPLVETPCIVIGRKGNVGEARLYTEGCWPIDTTYFIEIPETFVGRYLELELERLDLRSLDSSTTTPSLRRQDLDEVRLRRPSRGEQLQIVQILDTQLARLDTVLEAVQAVRDRADQLRRSLLHAAFTGQLTQPKQMRGEAVLSGWERLTLGDVARFINGRAYKKDELLSEGKYRVLRVGNLFTTKDWYWSNLDLEPDKYCDYGDLIYAWSASFGPRIWTGEKVIFHYHIWKLDDDSSRVERRWLLHWLEFDVSALKAAAGTGTTMMHVTKKEMERRVITVPSLLEQAEIVQILDTHFARLDKALEVADRVEEECGRLRRSLLQSAFTGELTKTWREANG